MLNGFLVKPITASMLFEEVVVASSDRSTLRKAAKGRSSIRQLAGMRILVVEDNLINQQVADELLAAEGAIVSLAANGQIAVDAVSAAAPQFDVVLMDIQMPVLDGYAATRLIREELKLRDLPIIAMSANVMDSDREACIAAGMNDHIGKPFDMGKLISLIIRNAGHHPAEPKWDGAHLITDQDYVLDEIPGLDLRVALGRMSGMRSLYIRTARDFIKILDTCIPELQQMLVSGDKKEVLMQLHTLKGNAGTLGANQLSKHAAEVEALCKSDEGMRENKIGWDKLALLIKVAGLNLKDAIAQLESAQSMKIAVEPKPLETAAVLVVLREIAALAGAANMDVLLRFAEQRECLVSLPDQFIDDLDEALQDLEFAKAHSICVERIAMLSV
jgi:CheY-like chemotaxis protein